MKTLRVTGNMKVATLKQQFKDAFGATLRVYNGQKFADDDATLASIRDEGYKGVAEIEIHGNMKVENFEKKFREEMGIKVQVATPDNSKLVDNDMTLNQADGIVGGKEIKL
ncbi:MAG: hypothetical protein NZM38_07655 [Cytophagales bacterium]|nr:hypothetical protein [Cytophagales bacterium]MDW8384631.1 hypothetical protein [Flammeovirgaceae bacterium]